ncbi:glycosyltransferase family 2 protein [Bifidobacterium jacchi]|uniref:Glycosyltransferase family 2 protein n=1 Tax=Bifidobacterium jacchi TaxID=2490545 RepID=A0A5N5RJC9_9BIFI|nr:glycosyltransferase family 2 protein [Bifidobacterium jacchi]KAB5607412.1 glycosyltransferase family 2 protein [Bifidobacterium jacchi]
MLVKEKERCGRVTVTVIVPVYNVENTLNRCVDSIVNQTYTDLQIILVDDGSPDGSPAMCDAWCSHDSRIEVIHQRNKGLSGARNAGLSKAVGEYVAFVDSDDYVEPDFIESMINAQTATGADMVICSVAEETADGENQSTGGIVNSVEVIDVHECCRRMDWRYITVWNKLYDRRLWKRVSFPEGKIHEDEYVFQDIVSQCSAIVVLPDELYHYVENNAGIMHERFSTRNLARLQSYVRRMRFFRDRDYKDCIGGLFTMIMLDVGRAGVLAQDSPESWGEVREVLGQVRALPYDVWFSLSAKQRIRFLQLKLCPYLLMRGLADRHKEWASHTGKSGGLR